MLRTLTASCGDCGITGDIIDMELFRCFPDSPSHVTYRARLQGTLETDSDSLISLIEMWVSNGAYIGVTGLHTTVDTKCSVKISSFSGEECLIIPDSTSGPNAGTTDSTTDSSGNTTGPGIVAGVVTVVVILIIAISMIVVLLILKYRHRGDPKKIK